MAVIGAMLRLCMFSEEEARLRGVMYLGLGRGHGGCAVGVFVFKRVVFPCLVLLSFLLHVTTLYSPRNTSSRPH